MVEVEIRKARTGASPTTVDWQVVARLRADGRRLTVEADDTLMYVAALPVVDPTTGRQILASDDAEAWARLLPTGFRAGDLVAVLVCGDDSLADAEETVPVAEPHIGAPRRARSMA
jgi:hypothetical protein